MSITSQLINQAHVFICALVLFVTITIVRLMACKKIFKSLIVVFISGTLFYFSMLYRYPTSHTDDYYNSALDIQMWLRNNTNENDLIFLPPDAGFWSGISKRGDWFNCTQTSFPIYAPYMMEDVMTRLNEYNIDRSSLHSKADLCNGMINEFINMDARSLQHIMTKYGIRYLVAPKSMSIKLAANRVYENKMYAVYYISRER